MIPHPRSSLRMTLMNLGRRLRRKAPAHDRRPGHRQSGAGPREADSGLRRTRGPGGNAILVISHRAALTDNGEVVEQPVIETGAAR